MIYIRIELWPAGDSGKARVLREVTVANMDSIHERRPAYAVEVSRDKGFKMRGPADENLSSLQSNEYRVIKPDPDSVEDHIVVRHMRSRGLFSLLRRVFREVAREIQEKR